MTRIQGGTDRVPPPVALGRRDFETWRLPSRKRFKLVGQ